MLLWGQAHRTRAGKVLVVLCALLVGIALSAQAIHFHADGTDSEKHCSVCSGAHLAMPVAQAYVAAQHVVTASDPVPQRSTFVSRDLPSQLFNRPPPASV